MLPPETLGENPSWPLPTLVAPGVLGLWLHHCGLCLCLHMSFPLMSSLRTLGIGFRTCLDNPRGFHFEIFNLIKSAKTRFLGQAYVNSFWLDHQHSLLGPP